MKQFITLVSFFLFSQICLGQGTGFDAQLIAGINAAQIRGDDVAGFNKIGLTGGLGVSYDVRYNMDLGIELLYSPRGSSLEFDVSSNRERTFKLNYLSIPIVLTLKDWLYEEESGFSYYRVKAHGGLSYGRLLSKGINGELGAIGTEDLVDAFNDNDISWLLGFGFQMSYRLGFRIRYERSITKLFKTADHPDINYNDLLPFHLALHFTYKL